MDPISLAITAAIVAGVAEGVSSSLTHSGLQGIIGAYKALKARLQDKYGADSKLLKAVEELESNPKSQGRKTTLTEEILAAKADQDPDLIAVAQLLLNKLKSNPESAQYVQQAIGNNIAQASGGSRARVSVNKSKQ